MSKGGAGKVYFVLYLAVILELLIIFIERDEAEEGLRRQQQQAIEIVQTILSQLQTGSGASGITVNPRDQIVLDPSDDTKNARNYVAIVSVGDPRASFEYGGKQVKGDDIPKLEYIVSHNSNSELLEDELGPDTADIEGGSKIFTAELGTEVGSYTEPRQTYGGSVPAEDPNAYFFLDEVKTAEQVAKGVRVKVFNINFKPNQGKGWYRLRLFSQTNKIVGITGSKANPDDTVRIGNVKLTVKQLENVRKALGRKGTAGEQAPQVLEYIDKLLTPGAGADFEQNKAYNSFNVRVDEPPFVKPNDPVAEILVPRDTIYWYAGAPVRIPVRLGPAEGTFGVVGFTLEPTEEKGLGSFDAVLQNPAEGDIPIIARAQTAAGEQVKEKVLRVFKPQLRGKWKGLRAVVGKKYNPSSEWTDSEIPESHYQTVVELNGAVALDQAGVTFKDSELPEAITVRENTKTIKSTVYWKPSGTSDRGQWVPLLSNDPQSSAAIKPGETSIAYQAPEQSDGFTYSWVITPKKNNESFGPVVLKQKTGPGANDFSPVQATVNCEDCAQFGVTYRLTQADDFNWNLLMEADLKKVPPTINGKRFDLTIDMTGKGGAVNTGVVQVDVRVAKK